MGFYSKRPNRLVLPRWRDFKDTSRVNELSKNKNKYSPIVPDISIQNQIDNWNREKTIINAIELVNSAFVKNDKEAANDAAKFILDKCKDETHPILVVSKKILTSEEIEGGESISAKASFENLNLKIRCKIQEIRKRLNHYPHNAMMWVDLAKWYTVIGKFYDAERAIKSAIQISPNNIFVIRSAVRFFIHKSRYDRKEDDSLMFALQLIRKNPATKFDPWLMATEISLCSYLEKTSSLMKAGFSLIESKNFNHFALSELSAALATEEMKHSTSLSKKLFINSLIDPNENTVAQAQWATKIIGDLPISLATQNSYEASSYLSLQLEEWEKSFNEALNWVVDQPFSCEPSNHASYLACAVVDDNKLSVEICDFGLRSNPNEFTLLNNKTYSLAIENNLAEAEKTFIQIDFTSLTADEKVAYTATKGLISYCKKDREGGDKLYNEAEVIARKNGDEKSAFLVRIYQIRSAFIFGYSNSDPNTAIEDLIKGFEKYKRPDIKKTIENVRKRLGVENKEKIKPENTFRL